MEPRPYRGPCQLLTVACAAIVWLRTCGCRGCCLQNRSESARILTVPDSATVLDTASHRARFLPALRLGYIVEKGGLRALPLLRRGRPNSPTQHYFLEVELRSRAPQGVAANGRRRQQKPGSRQAIPGKKSCR